MNCRDFERVWNERLDVRHVPPSAEAEGPLETHASSCPACLGLAARYQALRQALAALDGPPVPPGFADRVLAAYTEEPASVEPPARRRWRAGGLVSVAAAAAVVAAVVVGLKIPPSAAPPALPPASPEAPVAQARPIDAQGLSEAVAVATSATWDLAREVSAPAARVGRQVIVSARLPGDRPIVNFPVSVAPAVEVWRRVGDTVSAGVRPLEGTARHAFGFLIGEPADDQNATDRSLDGA